MKKIKKMNYKERQQFILLEIHECGGLHSD